MIFVDAHVHIYDCFETKKFFDSAYTNFNQAASLNGMQDNFIPVLLMAESSGKNYFKVLQDTARGREKSENTPGNWSIKFTKEGTSLIAGSEKTCELFIISGRQIISEEGFEVLALFSNSIFEDGFPIKELIVKIREKGGIPVIPWAFGKWMGERKEILANILENNRGNGLFLGDNGGRTTLLPHPYHFKLAEKMGIQILPGSDPLPFSSEIRRPGSYGFFIQGSLSREYPARDLKELLWDRKKSLKAYGRTIAPFRFIINQLRLQFRKYLK